jgi:rhodanese-related sulfurtransferase
MNLILPGLLVMGAISLGWFWFERIWDRRLFAPEPGRICVNMRPGPLRDLMQTKSDLQVLDVRSRKEFVAGALPGATNVPFADGAFRQQAGEMDRTRPVLVYCAGGLRSRKAVKVLRALGFPAIYHLHRGYYSWQLARLPVVRTKGQ